MSAGQEHYLKLTISPDKMSALLSVKPAEGSKIPAEQIFALLDEMRVYHGINLARIHEICDKGEEVLKERIAEGTPSIPGTDAEIHVVFDKPDLRPVSESDDNVNFFELHNLIQVKRGDLLATRVPPTPGIEGRNVHGDPLKPMPGKNKNFRTGKGVEVQGDQAVAAIDGALEWAGDKVSVGQLLFIDGDVDFAVGNICFTGKVVVNGHVRSGFKIEATDNIEIHGTVEDAVLVSNKGSIIVDKGIIGNQKAYIKACKNVEARFVQETTIEAGQNILISEYVIRSDIKAGNAILLHGVKGKLMGSNKVTAATRIRINTIQADRDLDIKVEGFDRRGAYARIKQINEELQEAEAEMRSLAVKMRILREQKRPEALINLRELLPRYIELNEIVDSLKNEQAELISILRSTKGEGMIEIQNRVDDTLSFNIKNERINLTKPLKNVTMYYDQDEKRIVLINN